MTKSILTIQLFRYVANIQNDLAEVYIKFKKIMWIKVALYTFTRSASHLYREHVMQLYDSGAERKSIGLDYINEGLNDDAQLRSKLDILVGL